MNATENYLFSDKVSVIGLDFDGCCTVIIKNIDGKYNDWVDCPPNLHIINLAKRLIKKGKEIHIVTYRKNEYVPEVVKFCEDHDIKVKSIINTSGESKIQPLLDIKADCHIDDDLSTCLGLFMSEVEPILVMYDYNRKNSSSDFIRYKIL